MNDRLRTDPIVTIDGPAGSGKSTTAREVAKRLRFRHLDSGALYRALTYALLESGTEPERWDGLTEEDLGALGVTMVPAGDAFEIRLGDQVLVHELRTEAVTMHASPLAKLPAVRGALLDLQRDAGRTGRLVADGRDMGTVVFPNADVKVYLDADLHERARRRILQRGERPEAEGALDREAAAIAARDKRDSERALSPLRKPEDALVLDTTSLSFAEQVGTVVDEVRRRFPAIVEERGHVDGSGGLG